jgi:hypothetical protein
LLLGLAIAGVIARPAWACSCGGFRGLLATARSAPHIVEARVVSHHPAPRGTDSIVVDVLRSYRGGLSGNVRLYGSGSGDCTVEAVAFAVDETYLFVLHREFSDALEGQPGFGLYGACAAVSARLQDDTLEGIFDSTRRHEKRKSRTMPLGDFLRAIEAAPGR